MTKYNAKRVEVDNIRFPSKLEAQYYLQLKLRKKAKQIADFHMQPEFIIQEGFKDYTGKKQRPIKYVADFKIVHNDGTVEIVDCKGFATQTYAIKKKMFLYKYPQYTFTEAK